MASSSSNPTSELTPQELASRVWSRLRSYRKTLGLSLGLLAISVPLVNFHPMVWGIVADKVLEKTLTADTLFFWLAIMLGTYLLGLTASAFHTYLLERTGQAFVRDIRLDLFRKFTSQSLAYHHDHSTGELVTRVTSDVDAMEQSVLQGLTGLVEEVFTFIIVAGMVLWISPQVGSLSILPLAISFIFIRLYNQRVKSLYDGVRRKLGNIGAFIQDRLAGVQVTQSFAKEAQETETFEQRTTQLYETSVDASRLRNTYFPVVSAFGFINNVIMLGVGAWLIMKGNSAFTVGALLAYRGFWWRLQSPIRTIAQTSDILQRARAAAQRVMQLLDELVVIQDPPQAKPLPNPKGRLDFDAVSFHYVPGKPILEEISFQVNPGEYVAVAGSSGSGKSTLLHLIPRYYDVVSGSIRLDGLDVREVRLKDLRSAIGWVSQDNYLFDGTVRENLLYGKPDAGESQLNAAAEAANAHEFILALPQGYETRVGQNGVKLSGGQRQRIGLARTFLADPTLLLLDEPTAAVEPESEATIHESIQRRIASASGTTILVTHRVELLRQAPRILFLGDGRVLGDGSHEHLIASCEDYSRAYLHWQREAEEQLRQAENPVSA